jgi:cytidine deaminase
MSRNVERAPKARMGDAAPKARMGDAAPRARVGAAAPKAPVNDTVPKPRVGAAAPRVRRARPALDAHDTQALIAAARAVRARAHAPYSRFKVGAAVLDEQGRIHAGCNVENAAYPQGWCAEASALAAMVAAGGRRVRAVAVVARSRVPTTPCGGCRQKLAEFAGAECDVLVAGPRGPEQRFTLGELLPHGFGPPALRRR